MSVYVDKISFENYRQFGNVVLRFRTSEKNSLSVLVAKNGTGKTTLLNAITWCLYEKEFQSNASEGDALPSISTSLISKDHLGEVIKVSVSITVIDDQKTVEFCRMISYKIEGSNGKYHAIKGATSFTATVTSSVPLENTGIKQDADADVIVKQYFDEAIYNFYFFDGEKLGEFFDLGRTKDIKESIFNISQISLLENARAHSEKLRYELAKKNSADGSELEELYARRTELQSAIAVAESTRDTAQKKIDRLSKKIDGFDEQLRTYTPIKQLQEERVQKDAALLAIETEEKTLSADKSAFLRKYLMLISLYPRIKHVLDIIKKKEAAGELPPVIDSDLIQRILDEHIQECPLCAGIIGEDAIEHLKKTLTQISVSSATSNNLKEIKGPLEDYLDEVLAFETARDELKEREIDIADRKKKLKARVDEISQLLSGFSEGTDAEAISTIERNRRKALDSKDKENQTLGAAKTQIANQKADLKEVTEEIKRLEALKKEFKAIKKMLDIYDMLCSNFSTIKGNIMTGMKDEIAATTWRIFSSMIWKQNTFGRIEIDDNYAVTVFDKAGRKMTGSLSATEQMALAYAFTLAIHEASGKNCPLVIDSPLGRVSDDNRTNMAKVLLDISKKKQIIMLFTPDEFSDSVKKLYMKQAQVSTLVLTDNEQHVTEVTTNE